jgi:hypothetical protein
MSSAIAISSDMHTREALELIGNILCNDIQVAVIYHFGSKDCGMQSVFKNNIMKY